MLLAGNNVLQRAKERGKGCGVIVSEERYAELKSEIEEERRLVEEAAKRRAEQVCLYFPFLVYTLRVLSTQL